MLGGKMGARSIGFASDFGRGTGCVSFSPLRTETSVSDGGRRRACAEAGSVAEICLITRSGDLVLRSIRSGWSRGGASGFFRDSLGKTVAGLTLGFSATGRRRAGRSGAISCSSSADAIVALGKERSGIGDGGDVSLGAEDSKSSG